MEVIRENIEYEQVLGQNSIDTVVNKEYIVPDTHPDVDEILMVDAKPTITSREIMHGKIYLEGEIQYNVLYLSKGEEETQVNNVIYTGEFSNSLEISGSEKEMRCEAQCYVQHMQCTIANERKISVDGIITIKTAVYKKHMFDVVRDLEENNDIQVLRNPTTIDKIAAVVPSELLGKCEFKINNEKPEIESIMKCDVKIGKKEIKIYEGNLEVCAKAIVKIVYKGKDTREISTLEKEVELDKQIDMDKVNPTMQSYTDIDIDAINVDMREDDLGEIRLIDVEFIAKANTKVMYKSQVDMIEDAYSPYYMLDINKKNYALNVIHGQSNDEILIKGDIVIDKNMPNPKKVIFTNGDVCITDKKLVEDKVIIEGLLNVKVLYRSEDTNKYICGIEEGIPFSAYTEIPGTKIDMNCIVKARIQSIEANVEPENIAIKSVVELYTQVSYYTNKNFIVDVECKEEEVPKKKASITIYVVQTDDTLWKIAKRYNATIEDLAKINNIEDINCIKVGDKLIIPGRAII